jgi:hypothetical protein
MQGMKSKGGKYQCEAPMILRLCSGHRPYSSMNMPLHHLPASWPYMPNSPMTFLARSPGSWIPL